MGQWVSREISLVTRRKRWFALKPLMVVESNSVKHLNINMTVKLQ